jgi:hypothetical protein
MSDDRKKPLWPWIVALLVGLPVLYVASFGPACWLADRIFMTPNSVRLAYMPVVRLAARFPPQLRIAPQRYGDWGSPHATKPRTMAWFLFKEEHFQRRYAHKL